MFMAVWRKKRGRRDWTSPGEREANEVRKVVIVHGSVEPAKRHELA